MSRNLLPVLALSALATTACRKYHVEDFAEDYSTAICDAYVACDVLLTLTDFESYEDCVAHYSAQSDPGTCEDKYNSLAAEDCIQGLNELSCEDVYAGEFPDTCELACGG